MTSISTIGILIAVVVALILGPSGVNQAIVATIGAVAVIIIGTASWSDVWRGTVDTSGVLVFLISMMVVALIAEEVGCFHWAADRAVSLSRQNGRLLFLNLYLLGALVTIFLSLDVTAIVVAPIVCALVTRARIPPLPFVMACAFVANTASLFLPVSNLTNMLVYSLLRVPFWAFVRLMTLPNLAAMGVNLIIFFLLFGRTISTRFDAPFASEATSAKTSSLVIGAVGLGLVVAGLVLVGMLTLPLYLPALVGALVLTPITVWRRDVHATRLLKGVDWSLPFFVVGMYTVIVAAGRAGLDRLWVSLLPSSAGGVSLAGLIGVAFGTAVGANLFNNIPMSLVAISGLSATSAANVLPLSFASLIGTNVGPNVTVFGSLATILVLNAARRYGIQTSAVEYLRIGLLTTPLMVVASTVVLWLLVR